MAPSHLTLGPLYYHWPAEKRRDFYFRIADEAPVDVVYVGEVVCSKREPFFDPYQDQVIERLEKAGKQVVLSSLALLTTPRELTELQKKAQGAHLIEANDVSAVQTLSGKPFIVGPMINVMNEGTLAAMAARGAIRVVFASELSGKSIGLLAAAQQKIETEVQVFGRQPLAISMRCYHARAHGRDKDHCRYACELDPDGMSADTIVGQPILTINGTQTLTRGYVVLLDEMREMAKAGVTHFRLAPQDMDMVKVAQLYRGFLDGRFESDAVRSELKSLTESVSLINGFYHGKEGKTFVSNG
ncbi:MAG TPA: U32 family peptidase [Rhodospirillaceae bacterium]|nr:U32 family peptidase [Rhodospirillaceae bacterium]